MNKTWKIKSDNIYVLLTFCLYVSVVFAYTGHIYQSNFLFYEEYIFFFPWE